MGFLESIVKKADKAKQEKANQTHSDPWIRYNVEKMINDSAYDANNDCFVKRKCPYCEHPLKQEVKKGNCPDCKGAIYVERHYKTKKQLLLTKEQIAQYEVEVKHYKDLKWALQLGQEFRLSDKEMKQIIQSTKTSIKFVILWTVANDIAMDYARNAKWLSYRNTRLSMAEIRLREGEKEKATGFYLGVCFLDLNGPVDDGSFNLQGASVNKGVLQITRKLTEELDDETLKELYLSAGQLEKNRFMPLTPEQTWDTFIREYNKKQ